MQLSDALVIVVGLGRSGVAAARLALARGARVAGTDVRAAGDLSAEARELGIELFAGDHARAPFDSADVVVVSPGVPDFAELDVAARRGVLVVGELEFAACHLDAALPLVAVGGTNGKSTVTTAVRDLFLAEGHRVFAGGNLGTPLSEAVGEAFDVLVVEVSSFQLERAPSFHPRVSVLMNITADHLDRYSSFQAYADAKGNAFVNQVESDFAVVPRGDGTCDQQARRGRGRVVTFGASGDYDVLPDAVVERSTGERFVLSGTDFHGSHNRHNAAAAIAAARSLSASAPGVRSGLLAFRSLPHRMALVRELEGVRFYDDSKATNVGAAVTALEGLSEPRAVLVAGGRDKLGSYDPLVAALRNRGRAAVVIGEAAERITAALAGVLPVVRAGSMDEAVLRARDLALPGDAVLLSPACASFDMFTGYADRGDRFALAARALAPRRTS